MVRAHQQLNAAANRCYRAAPFADDRRRVEYLFGLYEKLTAPLMADVKLPKTRRKRKSR